MDGLMDGLLISLTSLCLFPSSYAARVFSFILSLVLESALFLRGRKYTLNQCNFSDRRKILTARLIWFEQVKIYFQTHIQLFLELTITSSFTQFPSQYLYTFQSILVYQLSKHKLYMLPVLKSVGSVYIIIFWGLRYLKFLKSHKHDV